MFVDVTRKIVIAVAAGFAAVLFLLVLCRVFYYTSDQDARDVIPLPVMSPSHQSVEIVSDYRNPEDYEEDEEEEEMEEEEEVEWEGDESDEEDEWEEDEVDEKEENEAEEHGVDKEEEEEEDEETEEDEDGQDWENFQGGKENDTEVEKEEDYEYYSKDYYDDQHNRELKKKREETSFWQRMLAAQHTTGEVVFWNIIGMVWLLTLSFLALLLRIQCSCCSKRRESDFESGNSVVRFSRPSPSTSPPPTFAARSTVTPPPPPPSPLLQALSSPTQSTPIATTAPANSPQPLPSELAATTSSGCQMSQPIEMETLTPTSMQTQVCDKLFSTFFLAPC